MTNKILKQRLDRLIPKYKIMPELSKVVKLNELFKKKQNPSQSLKKVEKSLEKKIIEKYFTSKLVIQALNYRSKKLIKNFTKIELKKLIVKKNKKIYIK